ncbi:MAG: SsrA-binding protein SmpB [Thermodesulfovibrionales bacterium]|nr:SsrA-binding protein SmpB [Thermodesulfovibrionales bacterium]
MKIISQNRKAFHDYLIEDSIEAGIVLVGTEVKSLREGRVNLKDSYVVIKNDEAFLLNCHISPYSHGNILNHDPLRTRKLLLHKNQLVRLKSKMLQKGYALIPLKIYFKGPYAKVEVGLAKGKRQYEKRQKIKEEEVRRDIDRAVKERGKN